MPAVQTFAVYATLAVVFDFVFQTTAFLALLALDQKRYDVCYALSPTNLLITIIIFDRQTVWMSWFVLNWTQKNLKNLQWYTHSGKKSLHHLSWSKFVCSVAKMFIIWLYRLSVRVIVMIIFLISTCACILIAPSVELGLEQELSMPQDSHVLKYFRVSLINQMRLCIFLMWIFST